MFYNKLLLESQYASCGVLAPGYYVMLQHNLENSITNISVFPFPTFITFLVQQCVWRFVCAHASACGGLRSMSCLPLLLSTIFFRLKTFSPSLKLTNSTKLAGKKTPWTFLSLPPTDRIVGKPFTPRSFYKHSSTWPPKWSPQHTTWLF